MQGSRLYVGNLTCSVTEEQLRELSSNYGEVILVDRVQGRGFALVEVSNLSKAKRAKEVLDGPRFKGRP